MRDEIHVVLLQTCAYFVHIHYTSLQILSESEFYSFLEITELPEQYFIWIA